MFFKKKIKYIELEEISGDQSSNSIQALVRSSSHFIKKLYKESNARFNVVDKDELIIDIDGCKLFIDCQEDLFIVNEVFNEKTYGFNGDGEYIMIDIGANIGTSSLFFSNSPYLKKIYSYEPVVDTYEKLQRNIGLNPSVTNIETFNIGLGNSNRFDEFVFSESYKGSVGIIELADFKKANSISLKNVKVKIEKASDALGKIIEKEIGKKFIIKMDCEGGEFEILPDLKESGLLDKIDLIMLEWHNDGLGNLLPLLNTFNCFFHKNSDVTGMIYAYNRAKS